MNALPFGVLSDEACLEGYCSVAATPLLQLSFAVRWIDPVAERRDDAIVLRTRLFTRF